MPHTQRQTKGQTDRQTDSSLNNSSTKQDTELFNNVIVEKHPTHLIYLLIYD